MVRALARIARATGSYPVQIFIHMFSLSIFFYIYCGLTLKIIKLTLKCFFFSFFIAIMNTPECRKVSEPSTIACRRTIFHCTTTTPLDRNLKLVKQLQSFRYGRLLVFIWLLLLRLLAASIAIFTYSFMSWFYCCNVRIGTSFWF